MAVGEAALLKLVEAFNEGNSALRISLLSECWTENGRFLRDDELLAGSREELDARIASEREDPQFFVKLHRGVERSGDLEWTRWQVRRLHRPPEVKEILARRSPDGTIEELRATTADASQQSGKLIARLQEAVIANPIPAIGVLGGTLYLALRIPVGLFYGDLGVTPDEVGFGPQVLVPQSLTLLAVFLLAMLGMLLVTSLVIPVARGAQAASRLRKQGEKRSATLVIGILVSGGIGGYAAGVVLNPFSLGIPLAAALALLGATGIGVSIALLATTRVPGMADELLELKDQSRRSGLTGERMKVFALLIVIYGAFGLLIGLPIWALVDADRVRSGAAVEGRMTPWRALPVELQWSKTAHVHLTDKCGVLRLLGVANGQIVLFDTRLDKVFRVPVADASASVTRQCRARTSSVERVTQGR